MKILILEITGKTIDTEGIEYEMYEDLCEEDTETLNVFYTYEEKDDDFNSDNYNFYLGKNYNLLVDKIQTSLRDIMEELYYDLENTNPTHTHNPIRLSLINGNSLQASLDRVVNSVDTPLAIANGIENQSKIKFSVEVEHSPSTFNSGTR